MKNAKDNVLKDLLGIIGAFLSVYGVFLICVLILMAVTYLRALLSSGTLRERNYPKVREARAACFKDGRIVSRKIRDYCQILYDIEFDY